ncbi:MAG: hypothetical protein H6696_16050 [Deferribacteres bacterium]|nr:hypothetical protein [Deferribacteres bacterium]
MPHFGEEMTRFTPVRHSVFALPSKRTESPGLCHNVCFAVPIPGPRYFEGMPVLHKAQTGMTAGLPRHSVFCASQQKNGIPWYLPRCLILRFHFQAREIFRGDAGIAKGANRHDRICFTPILKKDGTDFGTFSGKIRRRPEFIEGVV